MHDDHPFFIMLILCHPGLSDTIKSINPKLETRNKYPYPPLLIECVNAITKDCLNEFQMTYNPNTTLIEY